MSWIFNDQSTRLNNKILPIKCNYLLLIDSQGNIFSSKTKNKESKILDARNNFLKLLKSKQSKKEFYTKHTILGIYYQ